MTMVAGISLVLSLEAIAVALLPVALAAQDHQFPLQRDDLFAHLKYRGRPSDVDPKVVDQALRTHQAVEVSLGIETVPAAPGRVYDPPLFVAKKGGPPQAGSGRNQRHGVLGLRPWFILIRQPVSQRDADDVS
jgi:hypothetical protein